VFVGLRDEFGLPSNHVIWVDESFGGLVGVYVPRVREQPVVQGNVLHEWKFGVFEVLGLYDVKTEHRFQTLTAEQASAATESATVSSKSMRARMEDFCRSMTA
jgi:hypothetical protein